MAAVTITTGTYHVYPGEVFTYTDDAFSLSANSASDNPGLAIDGSVTATGAGGVTGIWIGSTSFYNSTVIIGTAGVLRVSGADAQGYFSGSWSPDFTNHGLVDISATNSAQGLTTWDAGPWMFDNTATFRVTAGGDAWGVRLANAGTVHNSGSITVTGGSNAIAVWMNGFDGDFLNTGTITAHDPVHNAIGVSWTSTMAGQGWVNQGLIEADVSLRVYPYVPESTVQLFTNNGTMTGSIDLGPAAGKLVNNQVINGDVDLGGDNDVYDGRQGVLNGQLHGGAGNDILSGDNGDDTINGGAGDDLIDGGRDSDLLDGGPGWDTVTYQNATMGVHLDFGTGRVDSSGTDTISGFEHAMGGAYADTLIGSSGPQTFSGGQGDDVIQGGSGPNYVRGDEGNDSLTGGAGFDDINGNMGNDTINGGSGGDDWLVGGKDNDSITGTTGDDILYGNLGDDTLAGGSGHSILRGGQGNDVIHGGSGSEWLSGDRGNDTLSGGGGADIFHSFSGAGLDVVTDFHLAEGDRVQLDPGTTYTVSQVGADTVIDMGGGDQLILQNVQLSTLTAGWIFTA
jgi:Ca2+-binding RTX toxin-like protein